MAPFSLSWNSFDILRLLQSQEDPFELPGFVSTSPCDGTALPALEAGNELDVTQTNMQTYFQWIYIQYQNEYVCVGILYPYK